MNEGISGFEAERVRALGALRSLRSKKNLVAEKRRQTHTLSNEENEKWIEDYVKRETAGARQPVEDTDAAIRQEQDDLEMTQNTGLTTREPENTFPAMMVAITDSLSNIASSDDGEDAEDENDEERKQGKLSEDDKPGWVMGTLSDTVQQRMERFQQEQMKLQKLTHPGSGGRSRHLP